MNFYLDYNIYIYSLSDESIAQVVECLKKKSVQFFYSPAHVEEDYKAFSLLKMRWLKQEPIVTKEASMMG